jgi:hypothetical protein
MRVGVANSTIILFPCLFLLVACGNSNRGLPIVETENTVEKSDTLSFVGTMKYSEVSEKIDTSYIDTIFFYEYLDSVYFDFNELRYKFLEPSKEDREFSVGKIHAAFAKNPANVYSDTMGDEYVKYGILFKLSDDRLEYYHHLKREVTLKEEFRRFEGEAIRNK